MTDRIRLSPGDSIPDFTHADFEGETFRSESLQGQLTLLSFFRYAACPVCNEHLAELRVHHEDFAARGLRVVSVFHSPPEKLERYLQPGVLPFPVLPDPEMTLYRKFGVVPKLGVVLDPRSMLRAVKAMASTEASNVFDTDGPANVAPAEFLILPDLSIHAAHYGQFLGDTWSIPTLRRLCDELGTAA